MQDRIFAQGITFDDVLLEPAYSELLPSECDVSTRLTKNIRLNVPVMSSPMDTVTESDMAIALAQEGGIGIIHKNMTIEQQMLQVDRVKRSEHGVIVDPVTLPPEATVAQVREIMDQRNIGGVPIVSADGILRGIMTRRDLRFLDSETKLIAEVMTKDNLVTAHEHTDLVSAQRMLLENKVEKLLLIDDEYRLKGLITIKDIDKNLRFPRASKDSRGRLRVGAAIGVGDFLRAESLIKAGVDVLTVDSAHGHSKNVIETVRELKRRWSIDVIAGNIASEEGARDLVKAGADAIKVGIGPGSICTTRIVTGIGVPQITAVASVAERLAKSGVPLISDGGVRYSGDIAKVLATGAHSVMIGSLFAGAEEAPGEVELFQGRSYKSYRGMGSLGAMAQTHGSSDRYFQEAGEIEKLVPEGIEGRVPYKGPLSAIVHQMLGGVRAAMGYTGCRNMVELRSKPRFLKVTAAGMRESHAHDVQITKEAPNYRLD